MADAALPAPCPECSREAPRIMSGFNAFVMRDGYPRRMPDKGTYWHFGQRGEEPGDADEGEHAPGAVQATAEGEAGEGRRARSGWTRRGRSGRTLFTRTAGG